MNDSIPTDNNLTAIQARIVSDALHDAYEGRERWHL